MVVNSRGSNGSKSSRRVYKIASLATEPYLASARTTLCSPIPIESHRTPLPTAPHRCSPPRRAGTPLPTVPRRRSTVSTPHRASPPLPIVSRPHSTPHRTAPPLHHLHSPLCRAATPPSPLPNRPDSSWPALEDPSTTIFDTVALFPMTTMAMEMVMMVPTRSRLQPVRQRPLLLPEGALRRAPLAPMLVLVVPPRGRGH
jgi:hypothetical protein